MDRDFQIIVWGATGFTGQLVVEYLHINYGNQIRWAIAGRNLDKLRKLKDNLQLNDSVECLVGDSFDVASLKAITSKSDVIISTVGPYMIYGKALVEACVETGTDYCDLTGEVPFVKNTIESIHEKAKENGVKIVHSCGYDSIPSDIGCWLLEEKSFELYNEPMQNVKLFVLGTKGKFSGGTIASMVNLLKNANDEKSARIQSDPYALCQHVTDEMPHQRMQSFVWYDPRVDSFTAPFIMARYNSRIVFRSNDLLNYKYGRNFMYDEGIVIGKGMKGKLLGSLFMLGLGIFMKLMTMSFTRYILLKTVLPKPGEGPTKEERENGYFKMRLVGDDEEKERRITVTISNSNDPGYGSTAKMLAESALCLVLNKKSIPSRYGVLTPAVAFGHEIVNRLKIAGMNISVNG
ncbi:MAG: saccharopine dehydrogenase NADP-binding domain-containing protein [Candidatus Marinimicrobia bacterium]|nr:saccharopine dehydrogenase NADP-binding domain-containing protein [Candidatus Neomarinimicrobiota bacterium]